MVNEYTTTSLVEAEIRAENAFSSSTTPTSSQVTTWIQEASKEIELRSGQVFGSIVVSSSYLDYDGDGILRTPETPIISVQEVRYNENGHNMLPSWITLQEGRGYNYIVYEDEGEIEFMSGTESTNKVTPKAGKKRICLSYTHGFSTTPLEIQRLATLMVAKRVIMSLVHSQGNTEGGEVQVGTIRVSDPSNYSLSYIKSINEDIDRLYRDIGQDFKVFRLTRVYS